VTGSAAKSERREPLPPLPYSLVDLHEPKKGAARRLREADTLQWKLWIQKYAWILSLVTMVPGIGVIVWTVTHDVLFSVAVVAAGTLIPGSLFWWRTRSLP